MKILQIHLGELSDERKECVQSVRRAYPEYNYEMITDTGDYVSEMMRDLGMKTIPRRFDITHPKGCVVISDWLRFWICSKEDCLYLDTDVIVHKKFDDFSLKDKPYLLAVHSSGVLDYCVIYGNGCRDWFIDRLKARVENPNVLIGSYSHLDAHPIPIEYMTHIGPSSKREEHWQHKHWDW